MGYIGAVEFEEALANVERFQEEKGVWCDWLVQEVAGLLKQCNAWRALLGGYLRRRCFGGGSGLLIRG